MFFVVVQWEILGKGHLKGIARPLDPFFNNPARQATHMIAKKIKMKHYLSKMLKIYFMPKKKKKNKK